MRTPKSCSPPPLTDAMVASLEDYLPGGACVGNAAESTALEAQIRNALLQLEERLAASRRQLQSPGQFKALAAASEAVQSGQSILQLLDAGRAVKAVA